MALRDFKNRSPLKSHVREKTTSGSPDHINGTIAANIGCGCSLKGLQDNLSNLAKPTKYKISQIWPLFRHELITPAAGTSKKLDRGGSTRTSGTSARKGFLRSPSPQQQRKAPTFAGLSMQRENFMEISTSKLEDDEDEVQRRNDRALPAVIDDEMIPMGTIVCPAKGSPCCKADTLQCAADSGMEEKMSEYVNGCKGSAGKTVFNGRKRQGSMSPRSGDLYAAVEREFKRLGIYKEKEDREDYRDDENGSSPDSVSKHMDDRSPETPETWIDFIKSKGKRDNESVFLHRHLNCRDINDSEAATPSFQDRLRKECRECLEYQQSLNALLGCSHDYTDHLSWISSNEQEHNILQVVDVPTVPKAQISANNVVESFVSLSNVISTSHFSLLVKKSEASLQRFTNYLIKARQRVVLRENPSKVHNKHDITASLIRSIMESVNFESPHHFKYGLQACISKTIYDQFSTQSFGCDASPCYKINRQFMFLRAYYVLEALDNCTGEQLMEINGEFQQFCHRKLESMKTKVGWVNRWPSKLLQIFLLALKDVWLLHKLAFAFDKPVSIFFAKPSSALDLQYMIPIVESTSRRSPIESSPRLSPYSNRKPTVSSVVHDDDVQNLGLDTEARNKFNRSPAHGESRILGRTLSSRWNEVVQFSIFPGFMLQGEVLHSIVYLQPKTYFQYDFKSNFIV
ncbi:hypothetical protein KP509_24G049400 [Ceratopteris richardii]|uniref:Uncharacterized protein n=1 Tax=Ceratopteris richardii TaxID=49495 RepID=A0A8T2RWV4_CERRI|nr:hypothetical protein KP509_24G049400 [Ceratopteris richardii]